MSRFCIALLCGSKFSECVAEVAQRSIKWPLYYPPPHNMQFELQNRLKRDTGSQRISAPGVKCDTNESAAASQFDRTLF